MTDGSALSVTSVRSVVVFELFGLTLSAPSTQVLNRISTPAAPNDRQLPPNLNLTSL